MYILISAAIISFAGMAFLLFGPLSEAGKIPKKEFARRLKLSKPVFEDFFGHAAAPFKNFWEHSFLPFFLRKSEKIVARFRINVLKIERLLLRLTNYIRGKRENGNNGNTPYWKDLNDYKQNLK